MVLVLDSSFSFLILLILTFFFSWWILLAVYQFYFFKKLSLGFVNIFVFFICFISSLNYFFFFLLAFGFVLLFLILLGNIHVCMLSCFSHVWLSMMLGAVACQAPLSMEVSRQEYWSGLPWPPPGVFLIQGFNPLFLWLLLWQVGFFFTTGATGKLPLGGIGSLF